MRLMKPEEFEVFAAGIAPGRPAKKRGRLSAWWRRLWTYRRLSR